jgi:hypothetical protein
MSNSGFFFNEKTSKSWTFFWFQTFFIFLESKEPPVPVFLKLVNHEKPWLRVKASLVLKLNLG